VSAGDVAKIRAALAALRGADSPEARHAAKARVTTLGGQAALSIRNQGDREAFVHSLDKDIRAADG
jgi:hypothetical protein